MTVTIDLRALVAFASGLAVALIAVLVFHAWRVDASPGDSDATFVPITPCRLVDTRSGEFHVGPHDTFGPTDTKTIAAHGVNGDCMMPTDAVGLSLNVTALDASAPSFLTIWPAGERPEASSLNPVPGQPPTPNAVTTTLAAGGSFEVFNLAGTVDVIVDVNGYYTKASLQELAGRLVAAEEAIAANGDAIAELVASRAFAVTARDPDSPESLTPTDEVVASVTLTAPVDGQVTVDSTTNAVAVDAVRCSIIAAARLVPNVLDLDYLQESDQSSGVLTAQMAGTRTFDIAAGTTSTYHLVCDASGNNAFVLDSVLTAIFTSAAPAPCPIGTRGCR